MPKATGSCDPIVCSHVACDTNVVVAVPVLKSPPTDRADFWSNQILERKQGAKRSLASPKSGLRIAQTQPEHAKQDFQRFRKIQHWLQNQPLAAEVLARFAPPEASDARKRCRMAPSIRQTAAKPRTTRAIRTLRGSHCGTAPPPTTKPRPLRARTFKAWPKIGSSLGPRK